MQDTFPKTYDPSSEESTIEFWEDGMFFASDRFSPRFMVVGMPTTASESPTISDLSGFLVADANARLKRHLGHSVLLPLLLHDIPSRNPWLAREKTAAALRRLGVSYDRTFQAFSSDDEVAESARLHILGLIDNGGIALENRLWWHCPSCGTLAMPFQLKRRCRDTVAYSIDFGGIVAETHRPELLPVAAAIVSPPSQASVSAANILGERVPVIVAEVERPFVIDFSVPWHKRIADLHGLKPRPVLDRNGNYVSGPFKGLSLAEARQKILELLASSSMIAEERKVVVCEKVHECGTSAYLQVEKEWFAGDVPVSSNGRVPFPWLVCRDCGKEFASKASLKGGEKCPACGSGNVVHEHVISDELIRSLLVSMPCKSASYSFRVSDSLPEYDKLCNVCDNGSVVRARGLLGSDGREMSMELGNAVRPDSTMLRRGADALRVAAILSWSQKKPIFRISHFQFGARMVSKVWGIARFVNSCTGEGNPNKIDRFVDYLLSSIAVQEREGLESARTGKAIHLLWKAMKIFSSIYIPLSRHRKDDAGNVMRKHFLKLLVMSSPLLPFVSEEIYRRMYRREMVERSVSLLPWPSKSGQKPEEFEEAATTARLFRLGRKAKTLKGIPEREEIYESRISHEIGYDMREILGKALNAKNILVGSDEWTVEDGEYRIWVG